MKKSDLFLLGGSILFSLLSTEVILRVANFGYNNAPLNPSNKVHHKHPSNYSFTAYSPQGEWDNFVIKTNQFGDRTLAPCPPGAPLNNSHTRNSGQTILLGDSFVEGFQVKDSDTIAGRLQSHTCKQGIQVKNLGVSSYSPLVSYAQLCNRLINREISIEKNKSNTVIHILYDNDISGDRFYENLLTESRPCPIISSSKSLSTLQLATRYSYILRLLRRFQLTFAELMKSDRNVGLDIPSSKRFTPIDKCQQDNLDLIATSKYIKELKNLSQSVGANYFVSAIPSDSRKAKSTNYNCFKQIADLAEAKFIHAPFELFTNPEKYYFKKDIHLNPKGSILFAEHLLANLTD